MLDGKTIILGVTGSIAAYKIAGLASMLVKEHADVHVLMTANACQFITPLTFETLTRNKCIVDTFDRNFEYKVGHVALGKAADVMLIAPASADVIAKLAHGIADDMLTTTALACTAPVLVAPAMNTVMYEKQVTQDNISTLKHYGMEVIEPASGYLACGDTGKGKMPEPETLCHYIKKAVFHDKKCAGKKVLVTAGPTQEAIDPVRYITNHSSGKMGYALALEAAYRGYEVTLVSGRTNLTVPAFINLVTVTSAAEMDEAVEHSADADIVIMAAAVADYTPIHTASQKIKKQDREESLELKRTVDILKALGEKKKPGQFLCGFSMETERLLENSRHKLETKNLDMIVANNLKVKGAGFETDTNVVTLITQDSEIKLPLASKSVIAGGILDEIESILHTEGELQNNENEN